MMRAGLISIAVPVLAFTGCAVLTIDVDVYKGALANQRRVQTEQVAALAMGAKPLLVDLRLRLEENACREWVWKKRAQSLAAQTRPEPTDSDFRDACPDFVTLSRTANAVSSTVLTDRDARRVNAILSLYEDRRPEEAELGLLADDLEKLLERVKMARRLFDQAAPDIKRRIEDQAQASRGPATFKGLRKLLSDMTKKPQEDPSITAVVEAIKAAEAAAAEAWRSAMKLIATADIRRRLASENREAFNVVVSIAAGLTSPEGLRRLNALDDRPEPLKRDPLASVVTSLPPLADPRCPIPVNKFPPLRAFLAARLEEGAEGHEHDPGQALADQLLLGHAFAATLFPEDGGTRQLDVVVFYGQGILSESYKDVTRLADRLTALRAQFAQVTAVGLDRGRLDEGLEWLIEAFLAQRHGESDDPASHQNRRRAESDLFDGLINFAEKVLVIANNDILLRGAARESYWSDSGGTESVNRYVRVLQAVGNSIVSQVDALRHYESYRNWVNRTREVEVSGIKNAEAVAPGAVLKDALRDLEGAGIEDALLTTALEKGDQDVTAVLKKIEEISKSEADKFQQKQATAASLQTAVEVLEGPAVGQAVEALGNSPTTKGAVAIAVDSALARERDAAWSNTPPITQEAKRLQTSAEEFVRVIGSATLKGGNDNRQALALLNEMLDLMRAQKDAAARDEKDAKRRVDALGRSVASLRRVAGPGRPALTIPGGGWSTGVGTAKDISDVMLATLRYEHILAMKERGPDDPITKNLAAAIDLNYAYRSGMIHIHPASAYLRNSYPATVLQDDPTSGAWRNMLSEQALRQAPFYDLFLKNDERVRINNTIDKQFWQRVNQVRVVGVGRTNYAIAKDDVGNWYVKSYSSNPEDIIKSAKNLALFAAGPALGANFLSRGGSTEPSGLQTSGEAQQTLAGAATPGPTRTTAAPTSKQARSTLAKQLDLVSKRYEEQTVAARKSLKDEIDGLNDRLKKAVSDRVSGADAKKIEAANIFTPLGSTVIEALGQDKRTDGRSKPVSTLNAEVAAVLRALERHRTDLLVRLAAMTAPKDQTPDQNLNPELLT